MVCYKFQSLIKTFIQILYLLRKNYLSYIVSLRKLLNPILFLLKKRILGIQVLFYFLYLLIKSIFLSIYGRNLVGYLVIFLL